MNPLPLLFKNRKFKRGFRGTLKIWPPAEKAEESLDGGLTG